MLKVFCILFSHGKQNTINDLNQCENIIYIVKPKSITFSHWNRNQFSNQQVNHHHPECDENNWLTSCHPSCQNKTSGKTSGQSVKNI